MHDATVAHGDLRARDHGHAFGHRQQEVALDEEIDRLSHVSSPLSPRRLERLLQALVNRLTDMGALRAAMSRDLIIQAIVSGLLMGLIYALVAVGLSLIFGLMEIVNFAHGEFLMLAMFAAFWLWALAGLDPLLSLPLVAAMLAVAGVLVHFGIIRPTAEGADAGAGLRHVRAGGRAARRRAVPLDARFPHHNQSLDRRPRADRRRSSSASRSWWRAPSACCRSSPCGCSSRAPRRASACRRLRRTVRRRR